MVAGDDARSSITESENESIEIVFDSDSQVINHPLHTEELLEEGLTTMPCKWVNTRGGACRSDWKITATQQSSSNNDSHDQLRVIGHGQHQEYRRGWLQGQGTGLGKWHGFRWGRQQRSRGAAVQWASRPPLATWKKNYWREHQILK